MARRKAGPDGDSFPWRRKTKQGPGIGKALAAKRHRASCCTRRGTPGLGIFPPLGVGLWKAGKKSVTEIVAAMVLARCPQASTCTPCMLQTALDVMVTLPPDLFLLGNFSRQHKPKHLTDRWNR